VQLLIANGGSDWAYWKQLDVYSVFYYTKDGCQGKTQPGLGLNFKAFCDPPDPTIGHPKTFQGQLRRIFLLEQQVFL